MGFGEAPLLSMQRQVLVLVRLKKATSIRTVAERIGRDRFRTSRTCHSMQPMYLRIDDDGTLHLTPDGVKMALLIEESAVDRQIARILERANA